jgi:hypothetical protein
LFVSEKVSCRWSFLAAGRFVLAGFLVGYRSLSVFGLCWFVSAKIFGCNFAGFWVKKITPAPEGARAILIG